TGRDFNDRDTASSPAVIIINETIAKKQFGIENALGHRISFSDPRRNPQWMTIVGVVRDLAQFWAQPPNPEVYIPYLQYGPLVNSTKPFAAYMTLVARTDVDAASMTAAVKNAVWSVDRNLPISHVQTLQQAIGSATWQSRFSLLLVGVFSS